MRLCSFGCRGRRRCLRADGRARGGRREAYLLSGSCLRVGLCPDWALTRPDLCDDKSAAVLASSAGGPESADLLEERDDVVLPHVAAVHVPAARRSTIRGLGATLSERPRDPEQQGTNAATSWRRAIVVRLPREVNLVRPAAEETGTSNPPGGRGSQCCRAVSVTGVRVLREHSPGRAHRPARAGQETQHCPGPGHSGARAVETDDEH